MPSANEMQVGGQHYQDEYQHWDFVHDASLDYFLGNATKYVYRWRKKNGAQDLRKAVHYLTKAQELGIRAPRLFSSLDPTIKLTAQMENADDRAIVACIAFGDYAPAIARITEILSGLPD